MPIPLYTSDNSLIDFINTQRANRLENAGVAKLVRHKGHINRAILYRRPGDPHPTRLRDYQGQDYSFRQMLVDGHRCWKFRPLDNPTSQAESRLAPPETRQIFLRVVLDCMAVGSVMRLDFGTLPAGKIPLNRADPTTMLPGDAGDRCPGAARVPGHQCHHHQRSNHTCGSTDLRLGRDDHSAFRSHQLQRL